MNKFEKTILCDITKCYAVLGLTIKEKPYFIYAGEANGSIRAFWGENFSECELISDGGGGTMSIVPIPQKEGWFYTSRGFYSMVDCGNSEIDIVRYDGEHFKLEKIASVPYLHRFGVVKGADGTEYLVAASLHSYKEDKADWSHPGYVYYGVLPENIDDSFEVEMIPLPGDHYIHHGFCTGFRNGKNLAYTSCKDGVLEITPPDVKGGEWTVSCIIKESVSDIAVADIDGDGKVEIAALMPFHGNVCKVYKESADGFDVVYEHPEGNDFYHTVINAELCGRKCFVIGARKGNGELFVLTSDGSKIDCEIMETLIGPCNGNVLNTPEADYLLIASRYDPLMQAVYYTFTK